VRLPCDFPVVDWEVKHPSWALIFAAACLIIVLSFVD
jgi:hypothetical protein